MTATISPPRVPHPADGAGRVGQVDPAGGSRLSRRRGRIHAVLSMVSWLYLTVLGCLAMWVLGVGVFLGWTPHVTTSNSMAPVLHAGDIVLTSSSPDEVTLAVGSIVVYEGADGEVVHRITEVTDDGAYHTRGDANRDEDASPVNRAQIVGAGRLLVPFIGLPIHWLRSGDTTTFALWLVLTLLAVVVAPSGRTRRVT